jgi:hypothetical protein
MPQLQKVAWYFQETLPYQTNQRDCTALVLESSTLLREHIES